MRTCGILVAVACGAMVCGQSGSAQDMIGVNWGGSVYTMDSSTGTGSLLGPSGWNTLNGMAKDPTTGTIYTHSGGTLLTIDPTTGIASFAANMTGLLSPRGMAFDPAGTLFVIEDGQPDKLYTVNVGTGGVSLVGDTGFFGIQALAADDQGQLYAWDCGAGTGVGDGLIILNSSTGAGSDVNGAIGGTCDEVQGLAFGPDGILYGARASLYQIDTTTGSLAVVGSGGYSDVRGIEFTGPGDCLTLDVTALTAGVPADFTVSGAESGQRIVILYAFDTAPSTFRQSGDFCANVELRIQGNPQSFLVCQGVANSSGEFSCTVPVPIAAQGRTVYFQAYGAETCPDPCNSGVVTRTVQ
ncbi:MAG: hypothetical protein ACF8PN_15925 [Phycisphaerales bacterium]